MYKVNRNVSVEYTPRARTSEFPTVIARGGTEFRSQVCLGASVHVMGIYLLVHLYARRRRDLNLKWRLTVRQQLEINL